MGKANVWRMVLAGALAGTVNGLFGGGGGMVLVPALTLLTDIEEDALFPTSICVILPICLVSLTVTGMMGEIPWVQAAYYLPGSAAGGILAGILSKKIPALWLHRGLGLLILWGGIRYLC